MNDTYNALNMTEHPSAVVMELGSIQVLSSFRVRYVSSEIFFICYLHHSYLYDDDKRLTAKNEESALKW